MKYRNKVLYSVSVFLLMLIFTVVPVSAARENPFDDVSKGTYYYKPVVWALKNNITAGRTDTNFCPMDNCSRGQVVTFLWRAAGEPEPESTECPFEDVEEAQFASYYKAILWAAEEKITTGYPDGTFQPLRKVTRAEFVTFQYRANGSPDVSLSNNPFVDVVDAKHKNFINAILWAYENNITKGKDDTHFQPDVYCNRCNVVTFLYRYAYGKGEIETEELINNGGRFVYYKGNTYYWKISSTSLEQTIMGKVSADIAGDSNCQLICRASDGTENVLLKDQINAPQIYISDDKLYYQQDYTSCVAVNLDGSDKMVYNNAILIDVDEETNVVIYKTGKYGDLGVIIDGAQNTISTVGEYIHYIGCRDHIIYYGIFVNGTLKIYSVGENGQGKTLMGSDFLGNFWGTGFGIHDCYFEDDGIYITYAAISGSGSYVQGGGISKINYSGSTQILVDINGSNSLKFHETYFWCNSNVRYIFFYTGSSIGTGTSETIWNDYWVDNKNIKCINLETKAITSGSGTLSNMGEIVYYNGAIVSTLDDKGRYQTILSKKMIQSLGYSQLGLLSNGDAVYVTNMDIVDEKAYVTVCSLHKLADAGNLRHQEYSRDKMKVYEVTIGTSNMKLLYEY